MRIQNTLKTSASSSLTLGENMWFPSNNQYMLHEIHDLQMGRLLALLWVRFDFIRHTV